MQANGRAVMVQSGGGRQQAGRLQDQVLVLAAQGLRTFAFDVERQLAGRMKGQPVAPVGKDDETVDRMIPVRTCRSDLKRQVDLGRRELLDHGVSGPSARAVSGRSGTTPVARRAVSASISSGSGSSSSARCHWKLASMRRPTCQ